MKPTLILVLLILSFQLVKAENLTKPNDKDSTILAPTSIPVSEEWYQKIALRGYAQLRYNRLFETNPDLKCDQCDKSWGDNGGFFLRRVRLIFFGNVHERVYIYVQPDFASAAGGSLHYVQLRDAYFDLALDSKKRFRFRFGQSKIPFGFENLQSSQNRLPLDRHDGLNSAVPNERDLGLMFYYAPVEIRKRFAYLVNSGLKGSGDYGVFGVGLYNGQIANQSEANNSPHVVTRLSYPFQLGNGQFIEPGVQAYMGEYTLTRVSNNLKVDDLNFMERRFAGSLVVYPQPFGIQAEYNIGNGPQFTPSYTLNEDGSRTFDLEKSSIQNRNLHGGYIMASYFIKRNNQIIIPFVRFHHYEGGKKFELDATSHSVKEMEIGFEWQPIRNFELVAHYTISDRTTMDGKNPFNHQTGRLLRLQAQFNF
jgi:hypothetical protein